MKDIARAMGKTQMGVRALLHRSRIRLGERLREAGPSAPPRIIRAGAAAERASAAASASRKSPVL